MNHVWCIHSYVCGFNKETIQKWKVRPYCKFERQPKRSGDLIRFITIIGDGSQSKEVSGEIKVVADKVDLYIQF